MHIQYINLIDKSWITRHHTWYHHLSRIKIIKRAVLAKQIGGVLVGGVLVVGVFEHVFVLSCLYPKQDVVDVSVSQKNKIQQTSNFD